MKDRYLFRGKRVDNGEWVEGYLIIIAKVNYYIATGKLKTETIETAHIIPKIHKVDPSTICQCTGLRDKTGKLIWENDICDRKEQYPEIVKYRNGDWTLDYSYTRHKESGFNYCNLGFYVEERKCVEVIGNIFDNKELLEKFT